MWKKYKKIIITIVVSLVILTASHFTVYRLGFHRADEKWNESYTRLQLEAEAKLSGARDTITELEGTVESDGIVISDLRTKNEQLRAELDNIRTELGNLRLEIAKLREIQSATGDIYRELATILESDIELIDKIIAIARALQEAISNLEESYN